MIKTHSNLFRQFVVAMDTLIKENAVVDNRNQRALLDDLFVVENQFKKVLLSSHHGKKVYADFMDFILKEGFDHQDDLPEGYIPRNRDDLLAFKEELSEDGRNILRARVYFRERQNTFSKRIAKAFHKHSPDLLHRFKINYEFARWSVEHYKGPKWRTLRKLYKDILELRKILCENNLPFAINQAKVFWSKSPETHLEYMDLIQASSEGLLTAIDKFVPPYKTVFRSTAIGRMKLNMRDESSSTLVKLPPREKRILYRAKNAKTKEKLTKESDILAYVGKSFKGVTADELADIQSAAATTASIDEKPDDSYSLSEKLHDTSDPIDERVIKRDLRDKVTDAVHWILSIIERKVIQMKNGDI